MKAAWVCKDEPDMQPQDFSGLFPNVGHPTAASLAEGHGAAISLGLNHLGLSANLQPEACFEYCKKLSNMHQSQEKSSAQSHTTSPSSTESTPKFFLQSSSKDFAVGACSDMFCNNAQTSTYEYLLLYSTQGQACTRGMHRLCWMEPCPKS